jgi:hypothetical protein
MIAAEFEPAVMTERRRSTRSPIALEARMGRGGLERALCKVTDVSLHGAKIHTYSPMQKGANIWLTLPRIGQIIATIIWADEYEAGCQFREPLDDMAFERLTGKTIVFA